MRTMASILILGATSEVGRAACLRLARDGRSVNAWCHDPAAARRLLGADVLVQAPASGAFLSAALEGVDAVLHLSGFPGGSGPGDLMAAELSAAWLRCAAPPRHLVSVRPATASRHDDATRAMLDVARRSGARVVDLRAGLVLDPEEGALRRLMLLASLGAARAPRDFDASLDWIHRDDLVECAVRALDDTTLDGVALVMAAEPTNASTLARTVAECTGRGDEALRRSAPRAAWRAIAGLQARDWSSSERSAVSVHLTHEALGEAVADLLAPGCDIGPVQSQVSSDYLHARRPLRELSSTTFLNSPIDVVFPFFSRPENLCALTPRALGFRILFGTERGIQEGALIDYLISLGGLPMPWRTRIDRFEPPHGFTDSQLFGPYRCWSHEHRFTANGNETVMNDSVLFAPLGGQLVPAPAMRAIEKTLMRIFSFRARAMRLRFGAGERASGSPSPRPWMERGTRADCIGPSLRSHLMSIS